jgi:hypothetical protein
MKKLEIFNRIPAELLILVFNKNRFHI